MTKIATWQRPIPRTDFIRASPLGKIAPVELVSLAPFLQTIQSLGRVFPSRAGQRSETLIHFDSDQCTCAVDMGARV